MSKGRIILALTEIIDLAKKNNRFIEELSKIKGRKTIFIEAKDTHEKCYFIVENVQIIGPFEGDPADISVKIEATEKTLLDIWSGKLDPDAAWLFRKLKIKGPFFDAVRLKNLYEIVSEELTNT